MFVPTVATAVLSELQATYGLRFCVEASLKVPVAIITPRPPVGKDAGEGLTAMETIVAFVTVTGTEGASDPRVAVTFAWPGATPVAVPVVVPMVNTEVLSEDQVTILVKSWVLPSVYVPVAVNEICVPCAMLPVAGLIAIELTLAALTVREVLPVCPPNVALMVVIPSESPVAKPLTVREATLGLLECH